jgi:hypothetical protein
MSEMQDPIRLLREVPIDAVRLAAVRRRVIERLGRPRLWRGRWALAGATALAVSCAVLWLTRTPELEPPALTWHAPAPPDWALNPPSVRAPEPAKQPPRPTPRAPRVVSTENETALLEIPTSNPDVVLYWLIDSGGD